MRFPRLALVVAGIAFGVAAEWVAYDGTDSTQGVADFAVGSILLACGAVAWDRRPESRVGPLMCLVGFTWFLGTLFEPLLFLHRGALVQLLLSYPTGRLPSRLVRVVVAIAYVDAAIEPFATNDWLTLGLSCAVVTAAVHSLRGASGPARGPARLALGAVLAFEAVLVLGAAERLTGGDADRTILWTYYLVIAATAILLVVDLLRARWTEAVVTGLVVDLGASQESSTIRGRLARALGDPSLVVGYRLPDTGTFVDDSGLPIELPSPGSGRAATAIEDRGEQVAVLVHDEGVLADRELSRSVAAAARMAVANARLQAEAQVRADELAASRRRIVEATDAQRRRIEEELRLGAEGRLGNVATLLEDARTTGGADADAIGSLADELAAARGELRRFAQGVHPGALTDGGLMPALALLIERAPVPVDVRGELGRQPEAVEAALFFVCSEGLANLAKHAAATHASIELGEETGRVVVAIVDDGVGGAEPGRGSGLRGLADRVESLGGELNVGSSPGGGTRVSATIPVGR